MVDKEYKNQVNMALLLLAEFALGHERGEQAHPEMIESLKNMKKELEEGFK